MTCLSGIDYACLDRDRDPRSSSAKLGPVHFYFRSRAAAWHLQRPRRLKIRGVSALVRRVVPPSVSLAPPPFFQFSSSLLLLNITSGADASTLLLLIHFSLLYLPPIPPIRHQSSTAILQFDSWNLAFVIRSSSLSLPPSCLAPIDVLQQRIWANIRLPTPFKHLRALYRHREAEIVHCPCVPRAAFSYPRKYTITSDRWSSTTFLLKSQSHV